MRNNCALKSFNGDIGTALPDRGGHLMVFLPNARSRTEASMVSLAWFALVFDDTGSAHIGPCPQNLIGAESWTENAFRHGESGCVTRRLRRIRLIVPQAPGSASDTGARIVAAELTKQMGQQIVVDNRPGGALAISPNMMRKLPYDVQKDLLAVAQLASNQMLLAATPKLPFRTVREVIDHAKQNPGKLLNASSGNGTPGHVGFELFKFMTGTQIVHMPYKGGAAGITDLISGQVQLMMESLNSITPHAKAGRVRALAVSGATRSPALPDLPTIAEAGVPGYEASTWNGIVAPAGVPRAVVVKLNAEINKALASPALKERFAALGAEPTIGTPERFAELIRKENAKWAEVIKRSGAKID